LLLALNNEMYWSKTDSQEEEWLLAELFIPRGTYEVKIFEMKIYLDETLLQFKFVANRSELGRTSSDIAIDDISFESSNKNSY
jgi:hypothetical protein